MIKRICLTIMLFFNFYLFSSTSAIVINSENISIEQFNTFYKQFVNDFNDYLTFVSGSIEEEMNEIKKTAVMELIEEKILSLFAKKNDIKINEKEILLKLEKIMEGFPNADIFWEILKEQGSTFEDLTASLRQELIKEKVLERIITQTISVSTEDLKKYLHKNSLEDSLIEYTVTLLITNNIQYLSEIINKPNLNWDRANINKELSYYNLNVRPLDLPEDIDREMFALNIGQFSPVQAFDKDNFFSLRVEDFVINFDKLPSNVFEFIKQEKKKELYAMWLEDAIENSKIFFNTELFPTEHYKYLYDNFDRLDYNSYLAGERRSI
jgi:hypothetical protein